MAQPGILVIPADLEYTQIMIVATPSQSDTQL